MNSFFELQIKSELLKLMYLFFSENLIQIYTSKTENKSTILIKKIITYLKENYQNNITLQDLSKKFNVNVPFKSFEDAILTFEFLLNQDAEYIKSDGTISVTNRIHRGNVYSDKYNFGSKNGLRQDLSPLLFYE